MNKILNNILKGLITAFVVVIVGGILSLNIKTSTNNSMMLVSSSVLNSLRTDKIITKKDDIKVEQVKLEEEVVELEKEKKEENKKEETKEVIKEEVKEEPKKVEATPTPTPTPTPEPPKQQVPEANGSYSPNTETTSGASNNTFSGYMTAYGPDCYGCYGSKTAMGDYVGEGNIYYNHPTYGTIRIVAGDRSILNKVVRITGSKLYSEPVIAIVRDTGGDIGFNKPKGIVLDLLFPSEKTPEAAGFGKQWVTVEVLN